MSGLSLIWTCTFCLNAFVVIAAGAMMIRRFANDRIQRVHARRAPEAIAVLLGAPRMRVRGGFFRDPVARGALLDLLMLLRGREVGRLVDTARAHGAADAFRHALQTGSVRQRIVAAETLGFFPECAPALARALADPDERVGIAAMKSLVRQGDGATLRGALDRIRQDGAGRQSALAAVLREAAVQLPADVTLALAIEKHPNLQVLLIDGVAAARVAEATRVLERLAAEGPVPVQIAARQALHLCNPALAKSAA